MYGYIYKTTNLINGKIYIGQKRSNIFLYEGYLGSGKKLHYAISKYGKENFVVELLEECSDQEDLDTKEIYWIDKLCSTNPEIGYNISPGGTGGDVTINFSEERRRAWISRVAKSRGVRVAVTNDTITRYIQPERLQDYLDNGWHRGVAITSARIEGRKKTSSAMRGMIYYTNGKSNVRVYKDDVGSIQSLIDNGYYKGFTLTKKRLDSIQRKLEFYKSKRDIEMEKWWSTPHYCEVCGRIITSYIGSGRFCSRNCASTHSHTQETKDKLREMNLLGVCGRRGISMPEEERKKHSESMLLYYSTHHKCWINNGLIDKRVPVEQLSNFIEAGWVRGRIKGRQIAWNKGLTTSDERVVKNRQARDRTMLERYGTLDGHKANKIRNSTDVKE